MIASAGAAKRTLRLVLLCALALAGLGLSESAHAATWCGTPGTTGDRLPQPVAGPSVHFVYAIPSDGEDRLATQWGSAMQTDAETLDAWWRREDAVRTPRLDTFQHACGAQLDISLVRLTTSGAETDVIDGRAEKLLAGLAANRLTSNWQKYVVYYDGPDTQGRPTICGQGGGNFALIYVNACEGVPNDGIVAHELIHALGAVQPSAPHICPPPNGGHTCDNLNDIMYPFADDSNLFALLLDPGRDDYYGHAGDWLDVQDSAWLRKLDAQVSLNLSLQGKGTIQSDVPGALCTAACATEWDAGSQVTLTVTPAGDQRFRNWSGGCSGQALTCSLSLAQTTSVSAVFAPLTFGLRVSLAGKGRIRSTPGGVSCPSRCAGRVPSFATAVLVATPAKGWRFKNWFGACRGKALTCAVSMKGDRSARAVFVRKQT